MLNVEADRRESCFLLELSHPNPQHTAITVWTWANTNKQTNDEWVICCNYVSAHRDFFDYCALLTYLLTYKDQWWRHLVNAYEVKAYVWCNLQVELCDPYIPERLECTTIKALYIINPLSTFLFQIPLCLAGELHIKHWITIRTDCKNIVQISTYSEVTLISPFITYHSVSCFKPSQLWIKI